MNNKLQKHMMLTNSKFDKEKRYWSNKLSGVEGCSFPFDSTRSYSTELSMNYIEFDLSDKICLKLEEISKASEENLYCILLTGVITILYKYTEKTDLIIGAPIYKQEKQGEFINTILALRNDFDENITFKELIIKVKNIVKEAGCNQNFPIDALLEELDINSLSSLLQTAVLLENIQDIQYLQDISPNMIFSFNKLNSIIKCKIYYNTLHYKDDTVVRIYDHFVYLLDIALHNVNITLSEIDLLTEENRIQILKDFNNTVVDYPKNNTIQELFQEQVKRTPNNIAVVYEDKNLTYRELNNKSNQLARVLIDKGVGPESVVGIMVEKSLEMIIGIMGILKAGGAYLPIHSNYPKDRIEYMLEDSGVNILLIQSNFADKKEYDKEVVMLDDENLYTGDMTDLKNIGKYNDLAYIMYTSGSTGKPKGVMVEHRSVVRLVKNNRYIQFNKDDKILQTGAIVFDACTFEIWGALLNGIELHLVATDIILDANKFDIILKEKGITVLWLTASLFDRLVQSNIEIFSGLRYLLVGGDVLSPQNINRLRDKYCNLKIINGYGPTENTTFSTCFLIDNEYSDNIPIGKPISNSTAYIVDKNNKLLPVGIVGELCVGGDGLARGYLNGEELTAEKFVENPFNPGSKMYHTGDLARWLPDGNIEFMGRKDHQVKIRGYRIELGEVENVLREQAGVKEAIALVKEDSMGEKCLYTYLVKEAEITMETIRKGIYMKLPEYMIPSAIVEIPQIPLTTNGKVDRNYLLDMEVCIPKTREYFPPENEIEFKLVEMWRDILGIEDIGIHDNFFEIGGHSLKATILCGRIQDELEVEIGIRDIFEKPTIAELGKNIMENHENKYKRLNPLKKQEGYPVSSAQKRLYVMQIMNPESTLYNIPMVMELMGKVDKVKIEKAINALIAKHESLRTSFYLENDEILQKVHEVVNIQLEYEEAESKDEIDKILSSWIRPFNLNQLPLIRGGLIKAGERYLLLLDMHHIISDGTTMGILYHDFIKSYSGMKLETEQVQYKEYAQWEKEQKEKRTWEKQKEYWKKEYEEGIPVLELPVDESRGKLEGSEGASISFEIDEETVKGIKEAVAAVGGTLYMGLMAAFSILLSKYSGQEDIVIGSPIACRRHPQMEKVAGMFVNTLAIRTKPKAQKRIKDYLIELKHKLLNVYENQEYAYEELVEELNVKREKNRNQLFDVMLMLQNTDMKEMELSDIQVRPYELESKSSKFDITLTVVENKDRLACEVEFRNRLYSRETISQMMEHYVRIVKQISINKDKTIEEIELLDSKEKVKLLEKFNDTKVKYDRNKTIVELFEEQVERTPDNIAVIFKDNRFTYRELNHRSNQLARTLRENGIKDESLVGIMVEPSLDMMVAIIAILKAGGAYLPLDSKYPKDRIKYILKDSGAEILLTQADLMEDLEFDGQKLDIKDQRLFVEQNNNLDIVSSAESLAYVIYTSGSTGKPKGVMIENRSMVNFIKGISDRIEFKEQKSIIALTTIAFDIFGLETLLPLTKGMKVVIVGGNEAVESGKINKIIEKENITMLQATPSRIKLIMSDEKEGRALESLKEIMVGGEALSEELLKKIQEKTKARIYNMYGPTETTIWSTVKELTSEKKVTIGTPIANTNIYIIDKNSRLCPIGVIGELCISGDSLSRGYLGRPELTAEKFIDNPFQSGTKMYKTGDLARWLLDGNIEFQGRVDYQVKIRGYRIELEEIESIIKEQDGVKEVVVLVKGRNNENKHLCAYLVIDNTDVQVIKSYLNKKLPGYMIPTSYIVLDEIPLTTNGKIDRQALLSIQKADETRNKIPPRNYHDNALADIWKEILGIEEVYIDDDFFEMGGNSINIIQIANRIKAVMEVEISPADLIVYKTIHELSEYICSKDSNIAQFKHAFKINKSKSKKNIFIVHGGDADIFYYRYLAKLLEDEYSVYGLQPSGLNGEEPLPNSYFGMLHDYIKEIRMIQNEGPYIIAGFCIGGYLSYDIVNILEMQGDKVATLIQLDEEAFIEKRFLKRLYYHNILFKIIDLWRKISRKDKMYSIEKFMNIKPKAEAVSRKRQLEILKDRQSIRDYFQRELPMNCGYANMGFISSPTLVVKAEENYHPLFTKELWNEMVRGPLEYIEVPGNHETVLLPPYVEKVGDVIKEYLNNL